MNYFDRRYFLKGFAASLLSAKVCSVARRRAPGKLRTGETSGTVRMEGGLVRL